MTRYCEKNFCHPGEKLYHPGEALHHPSEELCHPGEGRDPFQTFRQSLIDPGLRRDDKLMLMTKQVGYLAQSA